MSLYRFIWTSLTIVLYLLIGMILFGVKMGGANLLWALLVLVVTIASFFRHRDRIRQPPQFPTALHRGGILERTTSVPLR